MRVPAIPLFALGCLAALLPAPANAAKLVTVAGIQQALASAHNDPDAKFAEDVYSLEPTERIDTVTLDRWLAAAPGLHSRQALILLADSSAFLPLPAAALAHQPPPDPAALHQIVARTIHYLGQVLPNLPNFLATRETTHFEDSPWRETIDNAQASDAHQNAQSLDAVHLAIGRPFPLFLYPSGVSTGQVTYRDGREVRTGAEKFNPEFGLSSRGEFGPILAVVVPDALRNKLYWDYWEQSPAGPLATFRYEVPPGASHYEVAIPSDNDVAHLHPPYHGEITVNPSTGAVLRLTLIAELQPPWQAVQAAIVVEYGPVTLGGQSFICPLHSIDLAREPLAEEAQSVAPTLRTSLNDVRFTKYHLFHAEARILTTPNP